MKNTQEKSFLKNLPIALAGFLAMLELVLLDRR